MKFEIVILGLATFAMARPQDPPPIQPSPSSELPPPLPVPKPTESAPPAPPTPTGGHQPGPICECGYTYCAKVLMKMAKPWSEDELARSYCATPNADCPDDKPATNVTSGLYICLCDNEDQKVGNRIDLVCGCDECLNVGPDFRGRCRTPCVAGGGSCPADEDDDDDDDDDDGDDDDDEGWKRSRFGKLWF